VGLPAPGQEGEPANAWGKAGEGGEREEGKGRERPEKNVKIHFYGGEGKKKPSTEKRGGGDTSRRRRDHQPRWNGKKRPIGEGRTHSLSPKKKGRKKRGECPESQQGEEKADRGW